METSVTQPGVAASRTNLVQTIRASDWWEFKLSPMFAVVYATAFILGSPISSLWPLLLLALAALVPGAAYVSVINDVTDREDDIASGKKNRLIGKSSTFVICLLLCCILPGIAVATYLYNDPLLLALYLAAWAAFSLYSIPPVRLKSQGFWGVMADASGANLFPTLFLVGLVHRWEGRPINWAWFISVAVWSLSFGLRGILWHQLTDLRNDEKIDLPTYVRKRTLAQVRWVGNYVFFTIEVVAFAAIVWQIKSFFAVIFLALYAMIEWARLSQWGTHLVVVVPKERASIIMLEYYEFWFPLAILLSSSSRYTSDILIMIAHLLFFPRRAVQTIKDITILLKKQV